MPNFKLFFACALSISCFSLARAKNSVRLSENEILVIDRPSSIQKLSKQSLYKVHGLLKIEDGISFFKVQSSDLNAKELKKKIQNLMPSAKIYYNYIYEGEYRESLPLSDPLFSKQYHHEVLESEKAWALDSSLSSVVVAVTDDGIKIDHEDLRDSIYVNTKEIPANGIDDDANGYIDDVNGWDFTSSDNNPGPVWSDHGTHVAGIIAATSNNGIGVSGIAPNAKIMPLRFYGDSAWTSEVVFKTFVYAANNGAQIISTSYNIDGFINDELYQAAISYVHQKGLLHFNSAGNAGEENPPRFVFDELIFVGSTVADNRTNDSLSLFSNYGYALHLCAPGGGGLFGILSTINSPIPDQGPYERMQGTSMAAPAAAAAAALIWGQNPNWSRDQVFEALLRSSENIDSKNSGKIQKLGSGRISPVNELSQTYKFGNALRGLHSYTKKQISIGIRGAVAPTSVKNFDFKIKHLGTQNEFRLKPQENFRSTSRLIKLHPETELPLGRYELIIRDSELSSPSGESVRGIRENFDILD